MASSLSFGGECVTQMSKDSEVWGAVVQAWTAPSEGYGLYVNAYDEFKKSGCKGLP